MFSPAPQPPFHLFFVGIVIIGMLCVLLVDETEQEVTQLHIQQVSHLFFYHFIHC